MNKVLLDKREGFAIVTLNRPDDMNALSRELRADFVEAFDECSRDDGIRVVILTGAGKAFCAGFDLKELSSGDLDASQQADNTIARAMEARYARVFPDVGIALHPGAAAQARAALLVRVIAWWVEDPSRATREEVIETLMEMDPRRIRVPGGA